MKRALKLYWTAAPSPANNVCMRSSSMRVMLTACAILFLSVGTRQGFGLLMAPTMADPGLTREQFALAVATQYLVWGIGGPIAGVIADRYGPRKTLAFGGLAYALGLSLASLCASAAQFWWTAGLLVGLGLGGASFGVVHAVVASAYPEHKRGAALGIVGAATAAGQLAMLLFTDATIGHFGWRHALLLHALAVVFIVVAAWFMRVDSPAERAGTRAPGGLQAIDEAMRRREFWLVALPFGFSGFQVMATMTHLPAIAADRGLGTADALHALIAVSGSAFFGQLIFGKLADRYSKPRVLAAVYAMRAALSLAGAFMPFGPVSVIVFFFALGLVWMSPIPLASGVSAQLFGTRTLASIFSVVFLFHQLGGFLGTWLAALVRDATGSYTPLWLAACAMCAVGAALSWRIERRADQECAAGTVFTSRPGAR